MYKNFEQLMRNNKTTSYQVAKETGVSQTILSYWKTGRSTPKVDKLKILAEYFGVSINELL